MKKRIFLLGCLTILSIGFLIPSAWADMGQFIFQFSFPQISPMPVHRPPMPQRQGGHWETRKVWIPPVYKNVWKPHHHDQRGRWVSGGWIRIVERPGYYTKTKVREKKTFNRYTHYSHRRWGLTHVERFPAEKRDSRFKDESVAAISPGQSWKKRIRHYFS